MIQEMDLMEIFYWFHRHPELSYEEYDTTAQIKKLLKAADVKILPIPMETGLIAEVKGEKDGPLQALRCEYAGISRGNGRAAHRGADRSAIFLSAQRKNARLRTRFSHHGGNRDCDLAAGT